MLDRLRELLARGRSLRSVAAELNVPKSTLCDWAQAAKIAVPSRRLSPETHREIQRRMRLGQSICRVARDLAVSKRTVWRRYLERLRQLVGAEYLPCKPWRCPACGHLINRMSCVADGTRAPTRTGKRARGRR